MQGSVKNYTQAEELACNARGMDTRALDREKPGQADTRAPAEPASEVGDLSRSERVARQVSKVSLVAVAALLVFGLGALFSYQQYWPFKPIYHALDVIKEAWNVGGLAPKNAVDKSPENASRESWTAHDRKSLLPGYRAALGYVGEAGDFGVWIFDKNGRKVHQRLLNYDVQDPDGPSGGSKAPHAFHMLADGSVVVNYDQGDVMTRYDSCGEPVWSREGSFHHSFAQTSNGDLWTWSGEVSAYDQYQSLVRFDPQTGETRQTIKLVEEVLESSEMTAAIFANMPGTKYQRNQQSRVVNDWFHPNDVEVLKPETASAFSQFEAGDLLMSFRNINLVTVMDPETYEQKWWSHGPWVQQHDPDFTANGEISVFNNNGQRGMSGITVMNPENRTVRNLELDKKYRFYTGSMGKHEYLNDGTLQVVVPHEGRVLEFDKNGKLLLEVNNLFNESNNAIISDFVWLPEEYFDTAPADFSCADEQLS